MNCHRSILRLAMSCWVLAAGSGAEAQIVIDAPLGGWKHSGGEAEQHMQDVHYPASRVNAGGRRVADDGREMGAAIRGHIAAAEKNPVKGAGRQGRRRGAAGEPHLLVVNGVPMPLRVESDGTFSRPYAFPPGTNNVEVRSADGRETRRVNFHDANPARRNIGLRVVLSWDSDMTDLDLHVVSPDGNHVFYGNRLGGNGGALDVDVTTGYGPEIYAIPSPPKGLWHVYVNYYGAGMSEDGNPNDALTLAQIAMITHEGTADEKREIFRVPMRRPGELTLVKSFVFP